MQPTYFTLNGVGKVLPALEQSDGEIGATTLNDEN